MSTAIRPRTVPQNRTTPRMLALVPRSEYPLRTGALTPLAVTLGVLMWAVLLAAIWALV